MERPQLHGLAMRLRSKLWAGTLTEREDWLLSCCISELEYRHRRSLRMRLRDLCVCELCWTPFPSDVEDAP